VTIIICALVIGVCISIIIILHRQNVQIKIASQQVVGNLNQQLEEEKLRFEQNWNANKALITKELQKEIEILTQQLLQEKAHYGKGLNLQKALITDLQTQFEKKESRLQKQIEKLNQQLLQERVHWEQNLNDSKSLITNDLQKKFEQKEAAFQTQVENLNQQLLQERAHAEQNLNDSKSLITNDLQKKFEQKEAAFQFQIERLNQENQQLAQELVFQFQIENLNQQRIQKNMRLEQDLNTAKIEYEQKKERLKQEKELLSQPVQTAMDSNIAIFENLMHVATADGQLTPNEKALLQEKAIELGLNYDHYEDKMNELLAANVKETNLIDKEKEKGLDFEKYVVQKFSKQYFKILDWAGDKYVEGRYAQTTLEPDLKLQFKYKNIRVDFAVECKYRSSFYKNGIAWATENQLKNFQNFSAQKKQPVFIIIGVGGIASAPEELYLVRLSDIYSTFLEKSTLNSFKKANFKENNIFFDYETYLLK
jgi:tellurite resistance protein